MFSGLKSQWRGWKLEIEGEIEEDAAAIGNERSQLRYIYSRLEGSAKTNITTFYELELRKVSPSPQALINRLDILYGERNRKDKAIQALHTIRQKEDEPFTAFYPRFEKEVANAEAESWEDSSKISYLRNALHPKLKAHLIGCSKSDLQTYVAFATKCEEISNQMELFGEWKNMSNNSQRRMDVRQQQVREAYPSPPRATVYREDMMEWEPTTAIKTNATRLGRNKNGYPSKRPEDQALIGKRAKWVEKSEIDKRWKEGRCLRCGRDGCRVERCPLAAAVPPVAKGTPVLRAKVTEAAVEEEQEEQEFQE
ncbi:hypothetical protein CNMCM6106_008465 [Aspergillus hiratsukae]|uniref:Uncharacterized protein n=1 Tax=Aspergillus hiratsukae TaxID=1194566 RepID=A0A8H6V0P3_9EURO|nr:hypothetical protein CNMCM6106_008465 [Aspergillus hiratsukae]